MTVSLQFWLENNRKFARLGGYFLLPSRDFHAVYIAQYAEIAAIASERISYTDNDGLTPFSVAFEGSANRLPLWQRQSDCILPVNYCQYTNEG